MVKKINDTTNKELITPTPSIISEKSKDNYLPKEAKHKKYIGHIWTPRGLQTVFVNI